MCLLGYLGSARSVWVGYHSFDAFGICNGCCSEDCREGSPLKWLFIGTNCRLWRSLRRLFIGWMFTGTSCLLGRLLGRFVVGWRIAGDFSGETVEQLTKIPLSFYRHSTLSINTCQTKQPLNGKRYVSALSLWSLINYVKYYAFQLCTLAHYCEDHGQIWPSMFLYSTVMTIP